MQLVSAHETDISLIRRLAQEIWLEHYPTIISMDQIQYMLGKMYSVEKLGAQMLDGARFYLVLIEQEPVGFIAIKQTAPESYFIDKFYLKTTTQNSGLGTRAFHLLLNLIPEAKEIRLQVNRQNFKSINFYFKNGFKIEYCMDNAIGDGYEMNDFMMLWKK